MSGRCSRDKGARTERAILRLLQAQGLPARKVRAMYKRGEDLRVMVRDVERSVEVKCRGDGSGQLYGWLDGRDVLIVKADRQQPLVVLPLSSAAEMARAKEQSAGAQAVAAVHGGK
jgi:hypothetical protein